MWGSMFPSLESQWAMAPREVTLHVFSDLDMKGNRDSIWLSLSQDICLEEAHIMLGLIKKVQLF